MKTRILRCNVFMQEYVHIWEHFPSLRSNLFLRRMRSGMENYAMLRLGGKILRIIRKGEMVE